MLTDLFEAVARQIILESGQLSVLAELEKVQLEDRMSGLPSWVPNWIIPMKGVAAQKLVRKGWRTKDTPQENTFDRESMFSTPHVLTLRGACLGTIKALFRNPAGTATYGPTSKTEDDPSKPEAHSGAAEEYYQPIIHAVYTLIQETCERHNIPI